MTSDRIQRQHRYTITPEHLILDPEVDDRAFRLWCRLDRYAGDNGAAFPFRESLSVELDCSLSSVDRAVEKLVKAGWLAKERMAAGDRNAYTLLVVPEQTVLARIKVARKEREVRWAGQRRKKPADAPSEQVNGGGVVTGDDRGGVVTGDDRVSSGATTGVVMGDAHKEASLSEHHGRTNPAAAADATAGRLTATVVASTGTVGQEVDLFTGSALPAPVPQSAPTFEDFWAKYPRKRSKGDAEKAWGQVAKKGAVPSVIMEGLDRFVEHLRRYPRDIQFVAYPATWLRGRGWEDEYDAEMHAVDPRAVERRAREESWLAAGRAMDAATAARQAATGGAW
jgi:hypothetical protein